MQNPSSIFVAGKTLVSSDLNSLAEAATRAQDGDSDNSPRGSLSVRKRRLWGNGAASEVDETKLAFGITIGTAGYATLWNPSLIHGAFRSSLPGNTSVQILGGTLAAPHYLIARYARLNALLILPTAYSTIPSNSTLYYYIPIAAVYLDSQGLSQLAYKIQTSCIFFPGEI